MGHTKAIGGFLYFLGLIFLFSSCKNAVAPGAPDRFSLKYFPKPNLVLDSLTGRLTETSATFTVLIKNIGDGPASASRLRIEFRLTDYDAPAFWLIDQKDYSILPISAGASCSVTYLREGQYNRGHDYVYSFAATVDPYQEVAETNESDNRGAIQKWVFGAIQYLPDQYGAPPDTDLTIVFSDPVVRGSGSIIISRASDGSIVESIDVTSDQVTISNATVTIDPSSPFAPSTYYAFEYADTCFDDDKGNSYPGGSWSFWIRSGAAIASSALIRQ